MAPVVPRTLDKESQPPDGYWQHSARPLTALVFVAPLVVLYEVGVLVLGREAVRNGAEVWMRWLLDAAGFGQYFLLPILICGILLGWHYVKRGEWKVRWKLLPAMWLECVVFAAALLLLGKLQARLFPSSPIPAASLAGDFQAWIAKVVAYLGAGLYEEVLFRLVLLSAIAAGLEKCRLSRRGALIAGVIITSLLFAAAHYEFSFHLFGWHFVRSQGDPFTWFSFIFRTLAGAYFAALFAVRGFGIAAGTHAVYDLLLVVA